MCVIAHKSWGIAMPSFKIMQDMFETNPDGAGIMWQEFMGGPVHFKKGLMTWDDFYSFMRQLGGPSLKRMTPWNVAVHFRIGTHGSKAEPILTQPFPIAGTWEELSVTEGIAEAAVAHNGVFHGKFLDKASRWSETRWLENRWSESAHFDDDRFPVRQREDSRISASHGWSDTMEWVEKILYPLYRLDPLNIDSPLFNSLVENLIDSSRVIVMAKNGTKRYGNWLPYKNWFVSNTGFVRPVSRWVDPSLSGLMAMTRNKRSKKDKKEVEKKAILIKTDMEPSLPTRIDTGDCVINPIASSRLENTNLKEGTL